MNIALYMHARLLLCQSPAHGEQEELRRWFSSEITRVLCLHFLTWCQKWDSTTITDCPAFKFNSNYSQWKHPHLQTLSNSDLHLVEIVDKFKPPLMDWTSPGDVHKRFQFFQELILAELLEKVAEVKKIRLLLLWVDDSRILSTVSFADELISFVQRKILVS